MKGFCLEMADMKIKKLDQGWQTCENQTCAVQHSRQLFQLQFETTKAWKIWKPQPWLMISLFFMSLYLVQPDLSQALGWWSSLTTTFPWNHAEAQEAYHRMPLQPASTDKRTNFVYCLPWTIYRQPGLEKHELGHPLQSPTLQRLFPYFILAIVLPYLVSPTHNSYSLTVYSSHAQGYIYIYFS